MATGREQALVEILATTRVVLLDFDGPVCDVFAGSPATEVAEYLRTLLTTTYGRHLPPDVITTGDPLHIIRRVADLAPALSNEIDGVLRAAEVRATATSEPTPGSVAVLYACKAAGRPVAIVSNNSAEAVQAYLDRHELAPLVDHVQGRDADDPHRMKPNPFPIRQALTAMDALPRDAFLVGDSEADLTAARSAEIRVVAFINKPGKAQRLAGADSIITDMRALLPGVGA